VKQKLAEGGRIYEDMKHDEAETRAAHPDGSFTVG
jgi:hypothetical protein